MSIRKRIADFINPTKPAPEAASDLLPDHAELDGTSADAILKALQASGVIPKGYKAEVLVAKPGNVVELDAEIKTGTMAAGGVQEMPSWAVWLQVMSECRQPGWAPGRFGVRTRGDHVAFPYGRLRADYGVHTEGVSVCIFDEDGEDHDAGKIALATVTHLPTGMGMGIFDTVDNACAAIESVLELNPLHGAPQFSMTNHECMAQWQGLFGRLYELWRFHGFDHDASKHCHLPGVDYAQPIWTRNEAALVAGKPERTS